MPACISLNNLTRYFGDTLAVDDLSIEVNKGEVFGLLGPNGAGKSTVLLMIAGLVHPTSGKVSVFGKNLRTDFLEIVSRMGVLVERPAFYEHLTIQKNLQLFSRLSGRSVTMDRALDLVGLLHATDRRVSDLSEGLRQRLGLALALLTEPELLVLDEPTASLDSEHTQEILRLLRFLADEASVTILLSSHMMHEVETSCDRVAVINQGKLISCEPTDVLLSYDKTNIEVLIDHPEAAAKRLRQESWVEAAEVRPGRVIVRLTQPEPHRLITFLLEKGYEVSGLIPRKRTLQEYFLKALNA